MDSEQIAQVDKVIAQCDEYLFGEPTDAFGYSIKHKNEEAYDLVLTTKLILSNMVDKYHKSKL